MRRSPSRTSITIDEAVSILLGRSTGPIEFELVDDTEEAESNLPIFDLDESLEDEREVLDGEYRRAKLEKQPEDVIVEKLAALQMHEAAITRAYDFHCAIADELNKGEQSLLKIDRKLSGAALPYITMHSFNEWVKRIDREHPANLKNANKLKARSRLREQEEAILAEIRKQNIDPKLLPKQPSGMPGVKAAVRNALRKSSLFKGPKTFEKAWERLRNDRSIVDAGRPPSPQKNDGGDL